MNLSDMAIIASIVAGLASVPFVASTISNDYGPIGDIILNMSSDEIPGELSRKISDDRFEQNYKTPFGRFKITVIPTGVYQELVRPDRKIIIENTPYHDSWIVITSDYKLVINKTSGMKVERFESKDGFIEIVEYMGNRDEVIKGNVQDYEDAKKTLKEELSRINKIREKYMNIPGTENITSSDKVKINEVLPNPDDTQDCNGDGSFTDSGDEFIELYNYGDEDIDLSGWKISDNNDLTIESGTTIESGDFVYFVSGDKQGNYGSEWSGSWPNLNNGGDDLKIYNNNDLLVDEINYASSTEGKSWSRIPDGNESFWEVEPTPGYTNN